MQLHQRHPEGRQFMTMSTIGVVGAGTIGRGVAQSFAQAGFRVRLVDVRQSQLDSAMTDIAKSLRMERLFTGRDSGPVTDVLSRIETGLELDGLSDADFIVENVSEDWELKREVYRELDQVCRASTPFGVNTSAIPITRLAAQTTRADLVIGLHFMNPVPLMDMVEVIRGHFTSDATLAATMELLKAVGKCGVVVGDYAGFVSNRVLMLTINESIFCIQDQVSTAADIDRLFKGCFGHKMGPLETADLIGLDTVLNSLNVMYDTYRDGKFRPAPLLRRLVDAGELGRKTGAGFYTY
jgi:3-hydroxybutyryl-CoA dehydrogenase